MSQNPSSTQVLARKWRPRELSALVGQEHVVKALRHALQTGRLHHAYLFTGTRGVGKTTLARILAKALNCQTGVTDTPCGQCAACREIDSGRFVDLLEVDAATNTGVDEMRDLLDNAAYAPTAGRYKVYVIDEVHMLSKSAFNAMLKTLEEPPPHMLFILATTDPQKIPVTVLSRCLQFNLKQMPPAHVVEHLQRVLTAEQIPFELSALQLIGRAAQGSMRDALSLTDQAIAHGAGALTAADVQDMLGAVDQRHLLDILGALADRDGQRLLAVADEMVARSLPLGAALQNLASLLYRLSVAHLVPSAVAQDDPDCADLMALCGRFDPAELQLFYQIASHARRELVHAPDEATGFGMCLLRMLAFVPQGNPAPVASGGTDGSSRADTRPRVQTPVRTGGAGPQGVLPAVGASASGVPAVSGLAVGTSGAAGSAGIAAHAAVPAVIPAVIPVAIPAAVSDTMPVSAPAAPSTPASAAVPKTALDALGLLLPRKNTPDKNTSDKNASDGGPRLTLVPSTGSASDSPRVANPQVERGRFAPTGLGSNDPMHPTASQIQTDGQAPWESESESESESDKSVTDESDRRAQDKGSFGVAPFDDQSSDTVRSDIGLSGADQIMPSAASLIQTGDGASRAPAIDQVGRADPVGPAAVADAGLWPDRQGWPAFVQTLPATALLRQMFDRSQLDRVTCLDGVDTVVLTVEVRAYLEAGYAQKAGELLTQFMGRQVAVRVQQGKAEITAQARADALVRQRQAEAEAAIESDPFVRTLRYSLGASIIPGSVRPR